MTAIQPAWLLLVWKHQSRHEGRQGYLRGVDWAPGRVSRHHDGGVRVAAGAACIHVAAALQVVVLSFWEVCEGAIQPQLRMSDTLDAA